MTFTVRNSWIEGTLRHSAKCTGCQHAKKPSVLMVGFVAVTAQGLQRPPATLGTEISCLMCARGPTCIGMSKASGYQFET